MCVEMQTHIIWSCLSDLHQLLAVQTTLFLHLKAIQFGKALGDLYSQGLLAFPDGEWHCTHLAQAPGVQPRSEGSRRCSTVSCPARDWLEFLFHHWGRHRCLSPWCPGQGGLSPRTRAALASRVRSEVLEILGFEASLRSCFQASAPHWLLRDSKSGHGFKSCKQMFNI